MMARILVLPHNILCNHYLKYCNEPDSEIDVLDDYRTLCSAESNTYFTFFNKYITHFNMAILLYYNMTLLLYKH